MHGGDTQSLIGITISLHLITDDLYFDVVFHSYSSGKDGAGFSYTRTPAVPKAEDSLEGTNSSCEYSYQLPAGWSIISLPCTIDDPTLDALFPTAISLFEFDGTYKNVTTLEIGKGYWINTATPINSIIKGKTQPSVSLDLPPNWSMVGPGTKSVEVSSLGPSIISVFGFDDRYFPADLLEPGHGYWVNLNTAATLELGGSSAAKSALNLPPQKGLTHATLFAKSDGIQQLLHLGVEPKDIKALPPLPPSEMFDVRFDLGDIGTWQVPRVTQTTDFRIQLQGDRIQLGWKIPSEEIGLWKLIVNGRIFDLEGKDMVALEPGIDQVFLRQQIGRAVPQVYALGQNFPNPFNPATTIHYTLPEITPVSLTIYDIAGQVVRHLIDQKQVAGSHQVIWDGLDEFGAQTANGVYFYELRAGKFRALRKMLLLK